MYAVLSLGLGTSGDRFSSYGLAACAARHFFHWDVTMLFHQSIKPQGCSGASALQRLPLVLGSCVAAMALAACSQQGSSTAASGASGTQAAAATSGPSRLVFAAARNAGPLNPHLYSPNQMYAQNMVYEPLVKYTKEGKIIPWLAESWEIAAGRQTYTPAALKPRELRLKLGGTTILVLLGRGFFYAPNRMSTEQSKDANSGRCHCVPDNSYIEIFHFIILHRQEKIS